MELFITYDANWEAKLDKVLKVINATGYKLFFEKRTYGNSIVGIGIVLMCRDPSLNFKQRINYKKKERTLFTDIMLDYNKFIVMEPEEREKIVAQKLKTEIPAIIEKYSLDDFNLSKFKTDLTKCFKTML